uniref:Uncharacterized protein n=2 Tax=Trichobilharzia regenti TaxID=157069 RepID=A0AA85K1Y0_TRIRE|nr:unnamed protein product [Trichobilharzia regenti]
MIDIVDFLEEGNKADISSQRNDLSCSSAAIISQERFTSLTEFHLKPLNENQCDQYHQLLEGSKELPENSNLQELSSLFNERISHLRNNNNHHNHTFIYRNRVIFIGLLIITCCIIFPAIFFVCYTALHCQIKQDGLNETMTTNRFISDESSYYILNNNNNTNLLNSLHTLTFPSAFPTSTNDTTFINSSLLNISKIETLNQSNFSSVKQNPVNLDFGIFDEPSEKEYENVIRFLKLKFNNFYAYTKSDQDISLDNKSWSEQFRMNILWSLSLHIPNKKERTAYFNRLLLFKKQAVFKRYGIVIILCGSCKRIPQIREYLVGPLSQPIKLKLLNIYPFYKRPLTNIEYNAILDFLTIQTNRIDHIIQDAYSASYFMQNPLNNFWLLKNRTMNESKSLCQKQNYKNIDNVNGRPNCLIPTFASPLVTNQTPRRRCIWIRLSREVAPFIQYPVDVQFYVSFRLKDSYC